MSKNSPFPCPVWPFFPVKVQFGKSSLRWLRGGEQQHFKHSKYEAKCFLCAMVISPSSKCSKWETCSFVPAAGTVSWGCPVHRAGRWQNHTQHLGTSRPDTGSSLLPHLLPSMGEKHKEWYIPKIITAWATGNAHVIISNTSAICLCKVQESNLELNIGNEGLMLIMKVLQSPRHNLKCFLERRIKLPNLNDALDNFSLKLLPHSLSVCLSPRPWS